MGASQRGGFGAVVGRDLPGISIGGDRRGANPVAFGLLWAVEVHTFISLGFLAFFGWRWSESKRPRVTPGYSVGVFVTTYNEPIDVLEATLAGCAAFTYPHATYLLDDGRRREVAELARARDMHYITRANNAHAKARNINHALGCTNGELVFCLDADHVPLPDALDVLVGYFDMNRSASCRRHTISITRIRSNTMR